MARPAEALTYSVPEAAEVLGVGKNTVYLLTKRGDIPTLRIGRRTLIAKVALQAWVAANADSTLAGHSSSTNENAPAGTHPAGA